MFGMGNSSSMSTSSSINNLDFSPVFNMGDDNTTSMEKSLEQSPTVSPRQDNSTGVAASVGVAGGSGGPATMTRVQDEVQPTQTAVQGTVADGLNSQYLAYAVAGVGLVGLYLFSKNKKAS